MFKELERIGKKKPPRRMAKCHKTLLITKVLLSTIKVTKNIELTT